MEGSGFDIFCVTKVVAVASNMMGGKQCMQNEEGYGGRLSLAAAMSYIRIRLVRSLPGRAVLSRYCSPHVSRCSSVSVTRRRAIG
jgi:hypothetical protein